MKLAKVELYRDEVIGLKPIYSDIGNITEIFLENGDVVQDKRAMRSVVKALTASYAIDLIAQRRLIRDKLLNRKGILPFYLGKGRVFIPLKMRPPVAENDAVYGYVDLAHFVFEEGPGNDCPIILSNGIEIKALSNYLTVLGARHIGKAVLGIFEEDKAVDSNREQVLEAARILGDTMANMARQLDRIEQSLK